MTYDEIVDQGEDYSEDVGENNNLIATKHEPVVHFLLNEGYVPEDTPVLKHVRAKDILGKDVWGYLPMRLAAKARSLTIITLPPVKAGYNFSKEEVRACARLQRFVVNEEPIYDFEDDYSNTQQED